MRQQCHGWLLNMVVRATVFYYFILTLFLCLENVYLIEMRSSFYFFSFGKCFKLSLAAYYQYLLPIL